MNAVWFAVMFTGLVAGGIAIGYDAALWRVRDRQVFVPRSAWPPVVHTVFELSQLGAVDVPELGFRGRRLVAVVYDSRTAWYTLRYDDGTCTVIDAELRQLRRTRTGRWHLAASDRAAAPKNWSVGHDPRGAAASGKGRWGRRL